jgi:WD40 repeat protein
MEMDEMEQEEIQNSEALEGFILNISPRLEQYLQQNEIMDIFNNDYENLAEEELLLEQGTMTILQEYQSFTDLVNSKDKSISCIGWHPKQKGVVAVSCSLAQGFDDRISKSALTKKHVIIIWSFHDPILPQLILESPENVACFQFNPEEPWMIVAGCHNGQLVMWDISEYQEKLQSSRKPDTEEPSSVDVKDKQAQIPTIKYIVVSSIELSHRGPITHLEWLPKHFEVFCTYN